MSSGIFRTEDSIGNRLNVRVSDGCRKDGGDRIVRFSSSVAEDAVAPGASATERNRGDAAPI